MGQQCRAHAGAAERVEYQWPAGLLYPIAYRFESRASVLGRGSPVFFPQVLEYHAAEARVAECLATADRL
jgi:hypothetical protein